MRRYARLDDSLVKNVCFKGLIHIVLSFSKVWTLLVLKCFCFNPRN